MIPTTNIFLLAGVAAQAIASTIPVSVGKTGLTFEPNVIRAQQGDVIEFRFWALNHSVVAGDFANACQPAKQGGFFSGFFPTQANTVNPQVFRVTVNHTNPVPIYCAQNVGQHCKNGMVGVINPAASGQMTLDAYAALARGAGNAVSPPQGPFGGVVAQNAAANSTSGTATTTATATGGGGAGGGETTSTATGTATGATATHTGGANPAAGAAAPVAGLVAAVLGMFFV
ncbi:hypothetical protein VTK56DRAFT_4401 [Thermocarpiscus australiensis]